MRKVLIYILAIASLTLSGCAVERLPWVHRVDVQQGNVVEQDNVNRLEPGMSKRQVRYIMGTPLLVDPFHQDRWDYVYSFEPGSGEREQRRVTLHFQGEQLARITGDIRPAAQAAPAEAATEEGREVVVPRQQREPQGVLERLWRFITFQGDEEEAP